MSRVTASPVSRRWTSDPPSLHSDTIMRVVRGQELDCDVLVAGGGAAEEAHWFGVPPGASLCSCGWEAGICPREFAYPPADHETLLGLLPMNTTVNRRLLQQVRPWIEPAQSYEKNQLGLSQVFLNSLRLTWTMGLLAAAAVLLRAAAVLHHPQSPLPLDDLTPWQLDLALEL